VRYETPPQSAIQNPKSHPAHAEIDLSHLGFWIWDWRLDMPKTKGACSLFVMEIVDEGLHGDGGLPDIRRRMSAIVPAEPPMQHWNVLPAALWQGRLVFVHPFILPFFHPLCTAA